MDALLIALQFLTRIPLRFDIAYSDRAAGRSVLCYPAVGLLLGVAFCGLASALAGSPASLVAALLLTAWVWLTGGLHLDGLADCADAWIGGAGDAQRSLRIMKDPASGPIAVAVLVLVLLLKWNALSVLLEGQRLAPLLAAPMLGRCAILALMLSMPYVSPNGLANKLLAHLPRKAAQIVAVAACLLAWPLAGWPALVAACAVCWLVRRIALDRLGGATGDVYGAAVELTETAVLTAAAL